MKKLADDCIETTRLFEFKYKLRFRYFDLGHKCKYKSPKNVKYATPKDLVTCACTTYSTRKARLWYKPFMWLGNRNFIRYGIDKYLLGRNHWGGGGKVCGWIRRYITYD